MPKHQGLGVADETVPLSHCNWMAERPGEHDWGFYHLVPRNALRSPPRAHGVTFAGAGNDTQVPEGEQLVRYERRR